MQPRPGRREPGVGETGALIVSQWLRLVRTLARTPSRQPPSFRSLAGIAAALLALIPILSLIRPGMPNTADGHVHLLRALEASRLLRAGRALPALGARLLPGVRLPVLQLLRPGAHLLAELLA